MLPICEKGAKLYGTNFENAKKYCKEEKMPSNVLVGRYPINTLSERFYLEKWENLCDDKECDLDLIRNPRDARGKRCYPTKKADEMTGKLKSEISKEEKERICNRIFRDQIPDEVFLNIKMAELMMSIGAERYVRGELEDFTIANPPSSEMLYLWKSWMDIHGPDHIFTDTSNSNVFYPNTIKKPRNYYYKYRKWVESGGESDPPKGAIEWLLKGGDDAYLWLKTKWVRNKIVEKYPEEEFVLENRLYNY